MVEAEIFDGLENLKPRERMLVLEQRYQSRYSVNLDGDTLAVNLNESLRGKAKRFMDEARKNFASANSLLRPVTSEHTVSGIAPESDKDTPSLDAEEARGFYQEALLKAYYNRKKKEILETPGDDFQGVSKQEALDILTETYQTKLG